MDDTAAAAAAPENQSAKAHADKLGLNMDDIRKGWAKLGPLVRLAARLTPNKIDDAFVAFVDSILTPADTPADSTPAPTATATPAA